tara:strand:+ start:49 stop:393 length:345 start_codon:yes stop_codon:yes gene_type:complete
MINKEILYAVIIFLFNNIVIWFQLNAQLVWHFWKGNNGLIITLLLGIPVTYLFWLGTKIGYQGFGNLWAVRFLGFATGMITFPFLTYFFLGEPLSVKTLITIGLALIIMLLQLI